MQSTKQLAKWPHFLYWGKRGEANVKNFVSRLVASTQRADRKNTGQINSAVTEQMARSSFDNRRMPIFVKYASATTAAPHSAKHDSTVRMLQTATTLCLQRR